MTNLCWSQARMEHASKPTLITVSLGSLTHTVPGHKAAQVTQALLMPFSWVTAPKQLHMIHVHVKQGLVTLKSCSW